jgi:hypothetical protein
MSASSPEGMSSLQRCGQNMPPLFTGALDATGNIKEILNVT